MKSKAYIPAADDLPRIDPEFRDFLARPDAKQFKALEAACLADGIREPLVIWAGENVVVDGQTRYEIAEKHGLPFMAVSREFDSRDHVMEWMAENQLARRNLTSKERAYYIGKQYLAAKKRQGELDNLRPKCQSDNLGKTSGKTAKTVAEKNKTSAETVLRDAKFAAAVDAKSGGDPDAKAEVLGGGESKKKIIESAPILCPRCKRVGAVKDCQECAELAAEKKRGSKGRRPKNGRAKADWKVLERAIGKMTQAFESIFKDLGKSRADRDYAEANGHMNKFLIVIERVQKGAK